MFLIRSRVAFFLITLFFAVACVPYTAFEEGRQYVLQEDADSAFHYISSLPGDEGAGDAPGIIGSLVVLRMRLCRSLAPCPLLPDSLEHPPQYLPILHMNDA